MKALKLGFERWFGVLAALALLLGGSSAWAQWELEGTKSAVNFISTKNAAVAEVHSFAALSGFIGADGRVQLSIGLDSVETLIDIRNERMRELLFETTRFPAATINASVDPELIAAVAGGGVVSTELPATLSLHGQDKSLVLPLVVVGDGGGSLQVFTSRPVIVNAADFGLEAGVAALQKIAGLSSISTAVPVTVHLVFSPAS